MFSPDEDGTQNGFARRPPAGDLDGYLDRFQLVLDGCDFAGIVDMSLHQVPAQSTTQRQGAFQVNLVTRFQMTETGMP